MWPAARAPRPPSPAAPSSAPCCGLLLALSSGAAWASGTPNMSHSAHEPSVSGMTSRAAGKVLLWQEFAADSAALSPSMMQPCWASPGRASCGLSCASRSSHAVVSRAQSSHVANAGWATSACALPPTSCWLWAPQSTPAATWAIASTSAGPAGASTSAVPPASSGSSPPSSPSQVLPPVVR